MEIRVNSSSSPPKLSTSTGMKKSFLTLALIALNFGSEGWAKEEDFVRGKVEVGGTSYPYRLLAPKQVVEGEIYPLVLFLHGVGECGTDNEAQLRHFPERMLEEAYRERFPCFVLAPQCPLEAWWSDGGRGLASGGALSSEPQPALQAAVLAMEEVLGSAPIDRDRIYITGLSLGGSGVFDLVARYPTWFAAASATCAGGDARSAGRLAGTPFSIWHGDADTVVDVKCSREMAEAVRAAGGEVEFHELKGVGHNAWDTAYELDGAIAWMFERRRNPQLALDAALRSFVEEVDDQERIAFFGDSLTKAGDHPGGYVDQLRSAVKLAKPGVVLISSGVGGDMIPDLLKRFQKDIIEQKPTMVFIFVGINDGWYSKRVKSTPPNVFEAGVRRMVREFQESGATVVLTTPTVNGEKRNGTNRLDERLDRLAKISRRVAKEEGVVLCDMRQTFIDYLRVFNPDDLEKGVLTKDGLHFLPAGDQLAATEAAWSLARAAAER
ncbi:MAG: lysophospholipase L1-like esterase/predicted esterase [Planctomycetota bacterium]|jgi:lysophospholipase L1-like esterase/predicted esterase